MFRHGRIEPPGPKRIALGVIPARWGATRFEGKPLALIGGRPLVEHVWLRARAAMTLSRVIVATDDKRIADAVHGFGGEAALTPDFPSGTDRVAWVARRFRHPIVVNIQGDWPAIPPEVIDDVVRTAAHPQGPPIATVATRTVSRSASGDRHLVRVVVDSRGHALYFSRLPIPFARNGRRGVAALGHFGIYAFRRTALVRFSKLGPSPLEITEGLEQLRALENGIPIGVVVTDAPAVSVDTPKDVRKALRALRKGGFV